MRNFGFGGNMKSNEKKCPRCAEIIKKDAYVCKHCSFEYSEAQIAADKAVDAQNKKNGALGCAGIFGVLLLIGMCSSKNDEQTTEGNVATAVAMSPTEAKAIEERNKNEIAIKLKAAKNLPASDIEGNARAYEELLRRNCSRGWQKSIARRSIG